MADVRKAKKTKAKNRANYEKIKEQSAERRARLSLLGRDIYPLPKVKDPKRRLKARASFRFFCEAYFPRTFYMPWAKDHLKVILKIERAIKYGGLFAMAMPRGMGKTTIAEMGCLWGGMTGRRRYIVAIGSELDSATSVLNSIKMELETNELLLEDFPEICYPIHCLEGIHQRTKGQICQGKPTGIGWTSDELVLPTVARSKASGGIIRCVGIGGRIRGMKHKTLQGDAIRPDLVVIDDPQTDESARSPMQVRTRLELLNGAILNLSGPGKKIAGVMPCTCIQQGDMADQILDRKECPIWQGERTKLVYSFPTNTKLWLEYVEIRNAELASDGTGKQATEFYRQNREEMDEGCVVAWKEWFNPDELSAIQHAMNLRYMNKGGERAFWAEYQNEPLPQDEEIVGDRIKPGQVKEKLNGMPENVVPMGVTELTAFIDVHSEAHYWMVCGWESTNTGSIVAYGSFPRQPKPYFTLDRLDHPMSKIIKKAGVGAMGLEGRIYAGLEAACEMILAKEWMSEDGSVHRIGRCLIDANWGQSTDVVYRFCRQSPHAALLLPSHGKYVGASSLPMGDYKKQARDVVGLNWRIPGTRKGRAVRHIVFDTNYWKSFVLSRFFTPMGDPGSLTLWGNRSNGHELLMDHLVSEYCIKTQGRGRTVEEWKMAGIASFDNHWFDCLVGNAVAASERGVSMFKVDAVAHPASLRLSQIQAAKKARKVE